MTGAPLDGRVALVTGAGRGVGAGIARVLAADGAVVGVNDLHPDRAAAVAGELGAAGARAVPVPFDVTDAAAVAAGVAALTAAAGPVDIVVNNAGIPDDGMPLVPFVGSDPEVWRRFIDLNLYGVLHCTHAVVGGMVERGWGRVVVISSEAGRCGTADLPIALYGAAKAGAVGFLRHLAQEVAPAGVTVNALSLGLMGPVRGEWAARAAAHIPLRRLGTPEDAGAAVAFLCSEGASWITGQVLPVNGGSLTA